MTKPGGLDPTKSNAGLPLGNVGKTNTPAAGKTNGAVPAEASALKMAGASNGFNMAAIPNMAPASQPTFSASQFDQTIADAKKSPNFGLNASTLESLKFSGKFPGDDAGLPADLTALHDDIFYALNSHTV